MALLHIIQIIHYYSDRSAGLLMKAPSLSCVYSSITVYKGCQTIRPQEMLIVIRRRKVEPKYQYNRFLPRYDRET